MSARARRRPPGTRPVIRPYLSEGEWQRLDDWTKRGDESAVEVFARRLLADGRPEAVVATVLMLRSSPVAAEDRDYLMRLSEDDRGELEIREACELVAQMLPTRRT